LWLLFRPIPPEIDNNTMSNGSATTQTKSSVVIKGSWEDLATQAHRAAANQNDDAIALYHKVINGLRRLPEPQLRANKGHLHNLLQTAATLTTIQTMLEEDEQHAWRLRSALVLIQAGRDKEALAQVRSIATAPTATLTDWGNLVIQHIRLKQFAQAEQVLVEAKAWTSTQPRVGLGAGPTTASSDAYLANLRSLLALAQEQWDEAIAHYERAMSLDKEYKEHAYRLYGRLMFHDQIERALPFIQRDNQHPIRSAFWYGVALKRLGRDNEAKRQWERLIELITPKTSNDEFVEIVLTFYYLGDAEGRGLSSTLRALQSGGAQSWVLFFLAGLGWALRKNMQSVRNNFALAIERRKANAEGVKLSTEMWRHCQELLDDETLAEIQEYFAQS
jgi:tetratricopeptide (TPR) repeat protein